MSVFDPYDTRRPPTPGLNTGSPPQISTLGSVPTGAVEPNRYRSGALSALAPFLGWTSVLLALLMGGAAAAARALCLEGRLTAAACTADPVQLALAPAAAGLVGVALAAIGGSLTKRRRAAPALATLAGAVVLLVVLVDWFGGSLLGLPFP